MPQSSELHCEILTSFAEVEKISGAWKNLHQRVGNGVFGDCDEFLIWWKTLGQNKKTRLHVVSARGASGELRALLPLVVRRHGMIRILERAGQDVFDASDVLTENKNDAQILWHFVLAHGHFDVAAIKDIADNALSFPLLASTMLKRKQHKNFYLKLDFPSGDAWASAQPRKFRNEMNRKLKKMEATVGSYVFHLYGKGEAVPKAVIDALYDQKKAWVTARHGQGVFLHPGMKPFLFELAENAARKGTLYLAWLTCGETIIACHMGFIYREVLNLYIATYDSAFGYYSPGVILMSETIKASIDAKLREVDYMRGEEDYKHHFASGSRLLTDFIFGKSLMGKILVLLRQNVSLRKTCTVAAFFLLFLSSGFAAEAERTPPLHRGVNLSSWFANAPRQPLEMRDFMQIKNLGFDFVRLPVNPEFIGFKLGGDPQQTERLNLHRLDIAMDGLVKSGLDVILDIHPEYDFMKQLEKGGAAEEQFIALWKAISAHYKEFPNNRVGYQLLNEPGYYHHHRRYNDFTARLVKALRETEPNRLLIISTPGVYPPKPVDALKALALIPDPNIAYDTHYYQPYIVTHQGIVFGFEGEQIHYYNKIPYPSRLVDKENVRQALSEGATLRKAMKEVDAYVGENWTIDRIASLLSPAAEWGKENNVRVLVLEFGVLRSHIDKASRARWIADTRQVLDHLGIGWAYWDYTDGFGIMNLVGKTTTDSDNVVRFENPEDPRNARIADPEVIQALGLEPTPVARPIPSTPSR